MEWRNFPGCNVIPLEHILVGSSAVPKPSSAQGLSRTSELLTFFVMKQSEDHQEQCHHLMPPHAWRPDLCTPRAVILRFEFLPSDT
jgi:hypothetical protein